MVLRQSGDARLRARLCKTCPVGAEIKISLCVHFRPDPEATRGTVTPQGSEHTQHRNLKAYFSYGGYSWHFSGLSPSSVHQGSLLTLLGRSYVMFQIESGLATCRVSVLTLRYHLHVWGTCSARDGRGQVYAGMWCSDHCPLSQTACQGLLGCCLN